MRVPMSARLHGFTYSRVHSLSLLRPPHPVLERARLGASLPHQAIDLLAIGGEFAGLLRRVLARDRHDHCVAVVIVDIEGHRGDAHEVEVDALTRVETEALLVQG